MIRQKINLVGDWLLGMRKRLSETLKLWKTWCSQKVQQFHTFMKTSRINKIVRNFIDGKSKTVAKKTTTKKKTATKKTSSTKKK